MRHLLEPYLVNDPFGDPLLYVDLHDEQRALLFDLGDLAVLPPRKLLRISHIFVTHTHMDHFAGFDQLLRVVLGRKKRIALLGGPGFVDQVEHKLRAYTWNVVYRYAVDLVLDVREVDLDGSGRQASFCSRTAFAREQAADFQWDGDVLHDEALLRVRGRFVDHEMPCLALTVEEKARPRVAKNRLSAMGVTTGAWLRELKIALMSGAPGATPIRVHWRDRAGEHEMTRTVAELAPVMLDVSEGRRIGYVTDLCFNVSNLDAIASLLPDVDQLFIESVFLHEDRAHAKRKNHLTARQAGCIARMVRARSVVPFHFSPRYRQRQGELQAELQETLTGLLPAASAARDGA